MSNKDYIEIEAEILVVEAVRLSTRIPNIDVYDDPGKLLTRITDEAWYHTSRKGRPIQSISVLSMKDVTNIKKGV